jgi:hypothetical protein
VIVGSFARTFRAFGAFVALAAMLPSVARADASTDVGIFAAIVAGQHVGSDNPVPVSGVVPGAALEVEQRIDRFRVHLEGIPTVGASGSSSGVYGHSSATLDLLNTVASYDVDANRRASVGLGYQLINLANTNGNNGDVNQVRIGSPIYALALRFPTSAAHGFETNLMIDPNLRGVLNIFTYQDVARVPKPEQGAEIDYAADYRWDRGPFVYRVGVRGLSYHTRNLDNGELVDRNVGAGVSFDARYHFGAK